MAISYYSQRTRISRVRFANPARCQLGRSTSHVYCILPNCPENYVIVTFQSSTSSGGVDLVWCEGLCVCIKTCLDPTPNICTVLYYIKLIPGINSSFYTFKFCNILIATWRGCEEPSAEQLLDNESLRICPPEEPVTHLSRRAHDYLPYECCLVDTKNLHCDVHKSKLDFPYLSMSTGTCCPAFLVTFNSVYSSSSTGFENEV